MVKKSNKILFTTYDTRFVEFLEKHLPEDIDYKREETLDYIAFYSGDRLFAGVTFQGMFLNVGSRLKLIALGNPGFREPETVKGLNLKESVIVGRSVYANKRIFQGWMDSFARDFLTKYVIREEILVG